MKKYLQFIYPIAAILLIFVLLFSATKAGALFNNSHNVSFRFLYMILFGLVGCVITLDVWLCKSPIGKMKYYLFVERLLIIALIFIFIDQLILGYAGAGAQIWASIVGYEAIMAVLGLIPKNKKNNLQIA